MRGQAFTILTDGVASNAQNSGYPWCVSDLDTCKHLSQMSAVKVKVVMGASAAGKSGKANTTQQFADGDIGIDDLSQMTSTLMKHGPEDTLRVAHSSPEALPHVFAFGAQYEDTFIEPGQPGAARITLSGTFRHICVPFGQVVQFMRQSKIRKEDEKIKPTEVVKFFASVTQDFCQIINGMNNNMLRLLFRSSYK